MEKIIKVVLCCIITTILVLCVWIFWDFCKFNQVNSDIEDLREKEINPIGNGFLTVIPKLSFYIKDGLLRIYHVMNIRTKQKNTW